MRYTALTTRIAILSTVAGLCAAVPLAAPSANPARAATGTPIYLDRSYSFAERAADLVARLTPAQRASQLVSSQSPAISTGTNPLLEPMPAGQLTLTLPVLAWLFKRVPERAGTILLSALVGHSAWHWMADRVATLRQYRFRWPALDTAFLAGVLRGLLLLVIAAAAARLMYGLARKLGGAPVPSREPAVGIEGSG